MLYLVATPIGNLEDLGLRALRILKEVPLIICERPSHTLRLLSHFQITGKKLVAYSETGKARQIPNILKLLKTQDAAFVSDAGTIAISDPGPELVSAAREQGIQISSVPGPSSLTAAIALSGKRMNEFVFVGFLPKKQKKLRELIVNCSKQEMTLIAFEAPHRIEKTLKFLQVHFPEKNITLTSEISKIHEKVLEGTAQELLGLLANDSKLKKGEFVLILG